MDALWWFLWMYLTAKSLRYAILTYSCCKQQEICTNLTQNRSKNTFIRIVNLEGLELDLRNSHDQ
jgi:hypothetical protein